MVSLISLPSKGSIAQYLKGFQWNTQKYRADRSLAEIAEVINQVINSVKREM